MSTSSSSPLHVFAGACGPNNIAFFFRPLYPGPLYLAGINITRNLEKGSATIAGRLKPGSASYSAGNADLQANESEFLRLSGFVPFASGGRLTLELRYDSSNLVTEIVCAMTSSIV
jgi:hypothetical protein